jgi:3-methyladenine DNA glycosylase AlkD
MTVDEVLALMESERDERGMRHWARLGDEARGGLRSFGIGLTRLRKFAKQLGRDRALSEALWATDVHEARLVALMIDDPAQITREQAERQVEQLSGGLLAHVFASCDATLAKTPFVLDLVEAWSASADPVRRACAYGLLYEASKFSVRKAPAEAFLLAHVATIRSRIGGEPEQVRLAMATALMGVGKRSAALNAAALKVARGAGPIEFSSASGSCEPFDAAKHLESARLKAKWSS